MEVRTFQTPLGEVWLRGRPGAFEGTRRLIVCVLGAFASAERLVELPEAANYCDVLLADLPGNRCPELVATSIGAYAAAFDNVLRQLDRPLILYGSSIGGVVALSMRAPQIRSIVAVDPPVRTADLWPLLDAWAPMIARPKAPWIGRFLHEVFGYSKTGVEARDYLPTILSNLKTPTYVLVGEQPLFPPRPLEDVPSLVDDKARALISGHPLVEMTIAPGVGHDIERLAGPLLIETLTKAARHLAPSRSP